MPIRPLLWLARVFINTFGITQPTPENEGRMSVLIAVLLTLVLLGVVVATLMLRASFHTGS